ncbi:MAG: winged helix-turn-helix domain-containing protein [Anaerolineae bacterium]
MTEKILLIEDDPAVAQTIIEALEREVYKVVWHNSGAAGIESAKTENPHLIILDVRLPDGSGFDFCRQLRAEKHNQPILMLTVQKDELDRVLGLEMGADAYMTKPFSLRELLATVRALLRRAFGQLSAAESNQIVLHDLLIDLDGSAVKRGREQLALTPTEFRLLVYLARNPGVALARGQILEQVWGYDDVESERTVNVHIRRLREKVEVNPSKPSLVLTVPGVGYRLVA